MVERYGEQMLTLPAIVRPFFVWYVYCGSLIRQRCACFRCDRQTCAIRGSIHVEAAQLSSTVRLRTLSFIEHVFCQFQRIFLRRPRFIHIHSAVYSIHHRLFVFVNGICVLLVIKLHVVLLFLGGHP